MQRVQCRIRQKWLRQTYPRPQRRVLRHLALPVLWWSTLQVVLRAKFPERGTRSISLDDIVLRPEPCRHPAHCEFIDGLCGYVNKFQGDFRWLVGTGRYDNPKLQPAVPRVEDITSANLSVSCYGNASDPKNAEAQYRGQLVGLSQWSVLNVGLKRGTRCQLSVSVTRGDGTNGTMAIASVEVDRMDTGRYLYLNTTAVDSHHLVSRIFMQRRLPTDATCVTFWWSGYGVSSRLNVYRFTTERALSDPLVSVDSHAQDGQWRARTVTITSDTEWNDDPIVAVSGLNPKGFIAIDDISVSEEACEDMTRSTDTFDCGNKTIIIEKLCDFVVDCDDGADESDCGECDFSESSCGWNINSLVNTGPTLWSRDAIGSVGYAPQWGWNGRRHGQKMDVAVYMVASGYHIQVWALDAFSDKPKEWTWHEGIVEIGRYASEISVTFYFAMQGKTRPQLSLAIRSTKDGPWKTIWEQSKPSDILHFVRISQELKSTAPYQDEFQCGDRDECIQKSRLCDFKTDCSNGVDESRCDLCGMENLDASARYGWNWTTARDGKNMKGFPMTDSRLNEQGAYAAYSLLNRDTSCGGI
ncbi:hypothetical protein MTO96_036790 [Rhipicephalus appendiculatus]